MTSPITLRGRVRFVKERTNNSDKLTVSAALMISRVDEKLNQWVDLPSDTLIATDNGTPLATLLQEHEGEIATVNGFWVIDAPVSTKQVGDKTYYKAAYKALRVTALEFDPPASAEEKAPTKAAASAKA